MCLFAVESEKNNLVKSFLWDSNLRLQSNPFLKGRIIRVIGEEKDHYVVGMIPLIPRFYLIGPFLIAGVLFFTGLRLTWWLLPGIILSMTGIFWSQYFAYAGLRLGLRKQGYKGYIKMTSKDECITLINNRLL